MQRAHAAAAAAAAADIAAAAGCCGLLLAAGVCGLLLAAGAGWTHMSRPTWESTKKSAAVAKSSKNLGGRCDHDATSGGRGLIERLVSFVGLQRDQASSIIRGIS